MKRNKTRKLSYTVKVPYMSLHNLSLHLLPLVLYYSSLFLSIILSCLPYFGISNGILFNIFHILEAGAYTFITFELEIMKQSNIIMSV